MEIIWGITGVGAPALFMLGVGLMAIPQAPSVCAQMCLYGSGAWVVVIGLLWLATTPQPGWVRTAAGLALGAFVFVVLPEVTRLARAQTLPQPNPATTVPITGPVFPEQSEPPQPPHDNTFYGAVPPNVMSGLSQGHDNTVIGPTDSSGNTIIKPGTFAGSHACGGPADIAMGSHAGSGLCKQ